MFTSRWACLVDQDPLSGERVLLLGSSIGEKVVRFGLLAACSNSSSSPTGSRSDCAQSPRFCPWAARPLFWSGRGRLSLIRLYRFAAGSLVLLIAGTLDQRNWGQREPSLPLISGRRILSIRNPASGLYGSWPWFQLNNITDRNALRADNVARRGDGGVAFGAAILGLSANRLMGLERASPG